MTPAPRDRPPLPAATGATDLDVKAIVALNNQFSADGLTLPRTEDFVAQHISDYRVVRGPDGSLWGQVALDEYSPSLCELVSLAVAPAAQGRGLGRHLINAAVDLANRRGYPQLFAVSLADTLFLSAGFMQSSIDRFPEKIWRYRAISRSELSIGKKFLFVRDLPPTTPRKPGKTRSRRPSVRGRVK
ncbi:MAG TPA: GNAT family N-acetyltransferase [Gemmatimonadaceae bacterium]|nr:GNAT family N-acetyltransferase [Gemmatimonadaceae bacterium]